MKSFILIGKTGCGKTSFCQALHGIPLFYKKTQSIEVLNRVMDTPGEYLENRRLNKALLVSSAEVEVIVLMQDCTEAQSVFAPNFGSMFAGKPVVGLITKVDIGTPEEQERAERFLIDAGCGTVVRVSAVTGEGVENFGSVL